MKLHALIFQETTPKKSYTYNGEPVKRNKNGDFVFEADGSVLLDTDNIETHETAPRESWSFPVRGTSTGKNMTETRVFEVSKKIAECLLFSAETSVVRGRKFTSFSLNKPIHILVNLNGTPILHTKDFSNLFNTFRMTYGKTEDGVHTRERFTLEELTEGINNIFRLAEKVNEVFKF